MAIASSKDSITNWTTAKLYKYILSTIQNNPANLPSSIQVQNVTTSDKLIVGDQLELSPQAVQYLKDQLGL